MARAIASCIDTGPVIGSCGAMMTDMSSRRRDTFSSSVKGFGLTEHPLASRAAATRAKDARALWPRGRREEGNRVILVGNPFGKKSLGWEEGVGARAALGRPTSRRDM